MKRSEKYDNEQIQYCKAYMNDFTAFGYFVFRQFCIFVNMHEVETECRCQGSQSAVSTGITCRYYTYYEKMLVKLLNENAIEGNIISLITTLFSFTGSWNPVCCA